MSEPRIGRIVYGDPGWLGALGAWVLLAVLALAALSLLAHSLLYHEISALAAPALLLWILRLRADLDDPWEMRRLLLLWVAAMVLQAAFGYFHWSPEMKCSRAVAALLCSSSLWVFGPSLTIRAGAFEDDIGKSLLMFLLLFLAPILISVGVYLKAAGTGTSLRPHFFFIQPVRTRPPGGR